MSIANQVDHESQKNPEELEREIDQKRGHIEDLVGALESRLSPGQLFDQALSYTKGHSGEFAHNLGNTLKANPVPAVLTSVGLLWLALGQNRSPAPASAGSPLKDKLAGASESLGRAMGSVAEGAGHTRDSLNRGSHDARDKVAGLSDQVSAKASETGERLADTAAQTKDALGAQAQQLKGTFDTLLREQPLVVGALGIALGALCRGPRLKTAPWANTVTSSRRRRRRWPAAATSRSRPPAGKWPTGLVRGIMTMATRPNPGTWATIPMPESNPWPAHRRQAPAAPWALPRPRRA